MKTKRLLYLFFTVFLFLSLFFWNWKKNRENTNWQFYVKDQIGAKSVINFGNDISFDDKSLFFSDSGHTVYSLNKKTGSINWTRELENHSPFKVTVDHDSVYVANFDSHIYRLDKKTGFIIWSFAIPNQYWPDTEVVFDENDDFVFFACRGGFLRALNKKNGTVAWQRQFPTIDNTTNFVEGTIHFGAIKQDDNLLFIKHFPSEKYYVINKNDGTDSETFTEQEKIEEIFSGLFIFQNPIWFDFNDYFVLIRTNVIDQPVFELLDKNKNVIWSYQSEFRINTKSIYKDENRLYFLNTDNTILNSLLITEKNPSQQNFKKLNFKLIENFAVHFPYKNSNPQVEASENKQNLSFQFKALQNKILFFLTNLKKLRQFNISQKKKTDYIEFSINHEQNFYKNVFSQVQVDGFFTNQNKEKIHVKGFYYDYNQWKLRVKLDPGLWNWQISIKTPYWIDRQTGTIEIDKQNLTKKMQIKEDWLVDENNQIIWPVGLQGAIKDTNRDGNPLNQMGHALNPIASKNSEEFRFIEFSDYLDLYAEEAKINFFRYGPDNWAPAIWKNLDNKKSFAMDINGNLQGDIILDELKKRNIKSMMSIFAFYPPYISQEAISKRANQQVLEQYLNYVIARYASLIDIWEISNEAIPSLEWLNFISNYLVDNDPYQHPITTNLEQPLLENSELLSIHWFGATPENNFKLYEVVNYLKTKDDWKKAIMISEWGFEKQNQFIGSADIMRKFTWLGLFKGMGIIFWNTGYGYYENQFNGNIYLGPIERNYLKVVQNFLPQLNYPIKANCQYLETNNLLSCSLENNEYYLIYLLKSNEKKPILDNKLPLEINKPGLMEIINPKNGEVLESKNLNKDVGEIVLPIFADDLAIKITY